MALVSPAASDTPSHAVGLRPFALPHPKHLRTSSASPAGLAHNTRRYEHSLAGGPGPVGVARCRLSRWRELRLLGILRSSALCWGSDKLCAPAHIHSPKTGVCCLRCVSYLRRVRA